MLLKLMSCKSKLKSQIQDLENRKRKLKLEVLEEEFYIKDSKFKLDQEVHNYKVLCDKEIHKLSVSCADDTAELEHEYHSKQEELQSEIKGLEARKETMENDVITSKFLLGEKDKEIDRLNKLCQELIKKQNAYLNKTKH
jgi:hypothetical protein